MNGWIRYPSGQMFLILLTAVSYRATNSGVYPTVRLCISALVNERFANFPERAGTIWNQQ